jgi:phage terminase small subunit
LKKKLTEKQKKFVRVFKTAGSITEAARRAGYANPNVDGNRLVNHSKYKHVQEALRRQEAKMDKRAWLTWEEKKQFIADNVRNGKHSLRDRTTLVDMDNKMESAYSSRIIVEEPTKMGVAKLCYEEFLKWGFEITLPEDWSWEEK